MPTPRSTNLTFNQLISLFFSRLSVPLYESRFCIFVFLHDKFAVHECQNARIVQEMDHNHYEYIFFEWCEGQSHYEEEGGRTMYMIWWQDSLLLKNTWVKANLAWRFLFLLLFLTNLHSYRFIGNYIIYLAKTDHYFVRVRLILFWMTQFGVFAKKETNETWVIATIAHLLQLSLLSRPYAIDSNVSTRLQEISNLFIRKRKKK